MENQEPQENPDQPPRRLIEEAEALTKKIITFMLIWAGE